MNKRYVILLTEEQDNQIDERRKALGFAKRSDYIRFALSMNGFLVDKINEIHEKVCKNA